jgi:hypothetical protein
MGSDSGSLKLTRQIVGRKDAFLNPHFLPLFEHSPGNAWASFDPCSSRCSCDSAGRRSRRRTERRGQFLHRDMPRATFARAVHFSTVTGHSDFFVEALHSRSRASKAVASPYKSARAVMATQGHGRKSVFLSMFSPSSLSVEPGRCQRLAFGLPPGPVLRSEAFAGPPPRGAALCLGSRCSSPQ